VQGPTRISYAGRTGAPVALVASTTAVALMFAATPFLISAIADRYAVSEGAVGLVSVVQVGAFAAANVILPRLVTPSGRVLRVAAVVLLTLNLVSTLPTAFGLLLGLRLVAGFAAGAMTWVAYTDAMQVARSMAAVAATGPTAVLVGSPLLGILSGRGDRAIYVFLTIATIPAVILFASVSGSKRTRGSISRSRSNRVLLFALLILTFCGSGLFINEALVARDIHDISPGIAAVAFSLNALGGLIGARLSTRHRHPGWWLLAIAPAAFLTVNGPNWVFFVAMAWWGFAFWMGIPGVLQMLSARSLEPGERAGDTQALMAVGRSLGPAMGGWFVNAGALVGLSYVSSIGIALAGGTVIGVQEGRERLPPTDPRTVTMPGDGPG
jgi:predicted MFS family arabinose efflux permease